MRDDGFVDLLIRLLWFYFIGLPLGTVWLVCAWFACLTIVGLPLGIWMVNLAPAIMTMKEQERWKKIKVGEKIAYTFDKLEQMPFVFRVLWFVLVGWWLSALWLKISLLAALTFIGIPVSFWMINRLPFVMTLHRG